jgi:HEPN domain-containing protein
MAGETKKDFYNFGMMMVKDSKILYENNSLHNSVYFAIFALESYLKMKLIISGKEYKEYKGHISDKYINRVLGIEPELFNKDNFYNMINGYDINHRYLIDKWTNKNICQDIQNELENVKNLLISLNKEADLQ